MNRQKVPQDKALKKAFGVLMERLQAAIDRHNKRRDAIRHVCDTQSLLDELNERAGRVRHLSEVWNQLSFLVAYYEDPELRGCDRRYRKR